MNEKEYTKIRKLGYGEKLIKDDNGNILDVVCVHYFDDFGECIFCGAIKYNSYLYDKLYR